MAAPKGGGSGGLEKAAASVLTRAVEHDKAARYTSALVCYQEGIQLLIDAVKETSDTIKRDHLRNRVKTYMDRAEKIKEQVRKEKAGAAAKCGIRAGTLEQINSPKLAEAQAATFYDKGIINFIARCGRCPNVQNFVRLCELLKKKCPHLKTIKLTTGLDQRDQQSQLDRLSQVKTSLADHGIVMTLEFSETLHDREIRLDTGWIIKIGRGLDYFRPTATKFSLGYFDHDLRTCHETTIDIFHRKYVHTS